MTFDHLGHGYSRKEGADVSLTDVKAFSDYLEAVGKVDRVMRGKGDGPYFLYAHSMGGAVGALYVKAHPDAFRGGGLHLPDDPRPDGRPADLGGRRYRAGGLPSGARGEDGLYP